MSEISETLAQYEERLTSALARIQAGLGKWPDAGPAETEEPTPVEAAPAAPMPADAGEVAELKAALEDEKTANAQLEQRVKQIKDRQQAQVEELEAEVKTLRAQLASAEKNAAKLRRSSEDARNALEALQTSAKEGMAEPHLMNKAMMAELESLRAERAADAAEISDIITAIEAARGEGGTQNA